MAFDPGFGAGITAGRAHNLAMELPIQQAAEQLCELLGATNVAAIGGVKETRAVAQWISGEREPQRPHVLRFALQLALMISSIASRDTARAWFHGANPHLDDRAPFMLLRDEPLEEVQAPLMIAARSFAARATNA